MDSKLGHSIDELEKLFSSRMRDYEEKLQKVSAGTTPTHSDLASLSSDFSDFKSFVCQTLSHFKTQVELLSLALDKHETTMRRKILLFHGVPEKANEKLSETILQIMVKQLKIEDMSLEIFEVCHRLGGSQGKTRPVLVRFRDMEHRRLVWDNKTALKGTGITISEFLTKARHHVFLAARKHFGINSCWSAEGKIIVLAPDKSRRKISCVGELNDLIDLFPVSVAPSVDAAASTSPTVASASPKAAITKTKIVRKARR